MKCKDLKCEFCDGEGERDVNIDGADCMCICSFCEGTGINLSQLQNLLRKAFEAGELCYQCDGNEGTDFESWYKRHRF